MPLGFTVFFLINIDNDLPQGLKKILNELIQQVKNLEKEVKKNGEKLDQIIEHQSMANSFHRCNSYIQEIYLSLQISLI